MARSGAARSDATCRRHGLRSEPLVVIRPQDYTELPENRHGIGAGSVLIPTDKAITLMGGTSRAFVLEQGGDDDTFVFLLGQREARGPLGAAITFLEGLFLSEK